jgi:hypothetical protein
MTDTTHLSLNDARSSQGEINDISLADDRYLSGRGEWYRSGRGKRDFVREVRVASFRERWVVSVMEMRVVSIRKSEWRWSLRGE